jgi:hypothetical protein
LKHHTGGLTEVDLYANNTGELLIALVEKYPALKPVVDAGVSIVIDGKVMAYSLSEPVHSKNEIYLLQRIKGG